MKIGILGAMPEEISSIKELMIVDKETTIAGRIYSEGHINGIEVVLVFSKWGKVASASTTTTLINKFDVDFVLFTGVAGAIHNDLKIGDIVIGSGMYQHDMDARPFFNQFQIPLTDSIIFKPRLVDIKKAESATLQFINKIENIFSATLLKKYSISKPSIHKGLIASGDKFVSDSCGVDLFFNSDKETTLAVEMEGAAVAQVCEEYNIPYSIIRVISDKADHSAAIDFQEFINEVASKYSSEIISEYFAI